MSAIDKRARVARVRRIQHGLASVAAANASGHVLLLETNRERLQDMRKGLATGPGTTSGAALASRGELSMRLETAREGLAKNIAAARAAASRSEEARMDARREQESAEKLEQRAESAAARAESRKSGGPFRLRNRMPDDGELL